MAAQEGQTDRERARRGMNYCPRCCQNFEGAIRDHRRQPSCPNCGSSGILPAKPTPFVVYGPPSGDPSLPPRHCRDRIQPPGPIRRNSDLVPLLAARDGWRCHLCGKMIDPKVSPDHGWGATIDHVIPLSAGGSRWKSSNMRLAHRKCNNSRRSLPLQEVRVARTPDSPPGASGASARASEGYG